jgi:hypothetical protein
MATFTYVPAAAVRHTVSGMSRGGQVGLTLVRLFRNELAETAVVDTTDAGCPMSRGFRDVGFQGPYQVRRSSFIP